MACMTLFAPPLAMATTQLTHAIPCESAAPWQFQENSDRNTLRMSWVVVTDGSGARRLRMQWNRRETAGNSAGSHSLTWL